MPERRVHARAPFSRSVRVGTLKELKPMLARDLSEGGIFIPGMNGELGDLVTIEFEASELPGVRFRAQAVIIRKVDVPEPGLGLRFEQFEEGGTVMAKLIKYLLDPSR